MASLIFSFILLGLIAGLLSGLLGIGGGVIIVPFLSYAFSEMGIKNEMSLAVGSSLAAMILITLSSCISHYKRKSIDFNIVRFMGAGAIVGSLTGAVIVSLISSLGLKIFFGSLETFLGIKLLIPELKIKKVRHVPSPLKLVICSYIITIISTMVGISGGIINVAFLTHYKVQIKKAIGTASAVGFLISLFGTLSFILIEKTQAGLNYTIGNIYIPAVIFIGGSSFLIAPYGAKLAHTLPTQKLLKLLGFALIAMGLSIILRSVV